MNKTLFGLVAVLVLIGGGWVLLQKNTSRQENVETSTSQTSPSSQTNEAVATASPSATESPAVTGEIKVTLENFSYAPKTITIKKGTKVTWTNQDTIKHDVVSDEGKELSTTLLAKGETYSHVFNTTGTFAYHCTPHPFMKATVIVE